MKTIFDGRVFAHYGQAYIQLPEVSVDASDARAGQNNGILGAARPGMLFLCFGLHTGYVTLTIKLAESQPPADGSWEEIVEASFSVPQTGELILWDWNGNLSEPLAIEPGQYRVRYSARNFGVAEDLYDAPDDEAPIEHYEVVFWPAPREPDAILKVTRARAQYWHDCAQARRSASVSV